MKFPSHPLFPQIQKEIEALLSRIPYKVRDFVDKEEYKKHPKQGIYAFTDSEDKEIVYIGKSISHWRGVGGRARRIPQKICDYCHAPELFKCLGPVSDVRFSARRHHRPIDLRPGKRPNEVSFPMERKNRLSKMPQDRV